MPVTNIDDDEEKSGRTSTTAEQKRKGYPDDWNEIATRLKEKHGWKCERCGAPHDPAAGYCLTVHHLDGNPSNCEEWNLAVLDQRCHLTIQGRVKMAQGFFEHLLPVSDWFRPHLEGYLASIRQAKGQSTSDIAGSDT